MLTYFSSSLYLFWGVVLVECQQLLSEAFREDSNLLLTFYKEHDPFHTSLKRFFEVVCYVGYNPLIKHVVTAIYDREQEDKAKQNRKGITMNSMFFCLSEGILFTISLCVTLFLIIHCARSSS